MKIMAESIQYDHIRVRILINVLILGKQTDKLIQEKVIQTITMVFIYHIS